MVGKFGVSTCDLVEIWFCTSTSSCDQCYKVKHCQIFAKHGFKCVNYSCSERNKKYEWWVNLEYLLVIWLKSGFFLNKQFVISVVWSKMVRF
jgi:hypothetical protein